ncbi:MAG: FtsX-like permease family protein [Actinomycetales bacterium]|nr:FtsX-like permease family protein [Actinomycetales bacterium]
MSAAGTARRGRDLGPIGLVAAVASSFGVMLLQVTGMIAAAARLDDTTGSSGTVAMLAQILAFVFLGLAVYVAAIVTSNTVATVVAGRVRSIALLRLLGSSARRLRGRLALEGLVVGALGSVAGLVLGTGLAIGIEALAVAAGLFPWTGYGYLDPTLALPVVAVTLTTTLGTWAGSRRVLEVTPLEALGGANERPHAALRSRAGRRVLAIVAWVLGGLLLLAGLLIGFVSPVGILVAFPGGVLSFAGVVWGADIVMPPVLRLVGRISTLLLRGPSAVPARLAAENALRYPERSARSTIGVVIGVTLITTFVVAVQGFATMVKAAQDQSPEAYEGIDAMLTAVTTVFAILIGFSALIAAIGLVNTLALSVLQRTREIGLLRALGLVRRQLTATILAEAAQLAVTAVVVGLVLGGVYGWVGAQSLLGAVVGGIVLPTPPWALLGVTVLGAAALALVASALPARRALRLAPIAALGAD